VRSPWKPEAVGVSAPGALPYVPALDGVRAIAVAAVLLYHGGVPSVPGGFLGVDVFFVLSGFLITSLLLAELNGSGRIDLRRFWLRRARRLLPAAFLVIAVSVVATALLLPADAARTRGDGLASFAYLNNWYQILADRSYFAAFERPSLLQHLWSLAVEEQFYLLWPLALGACLARLGRRGTVCATLAVAVLSAIAMGVLFAPGEDPSRVYFGTDTHASGLLIGALLAFAWPLRTLRAPPGRGAVVLLDVAAIAALAALAAAMTHWQDYFPGVYRGGLVLIALASAVLIAAVSHPSSRIGQGLGMLVPRWIGQRSYGIYLWHWPVMALTRPDFDLAWSRWALVPLQIALTVALAAASYRWVEQPVRTGDAGRALAGWMDRRAPRQRLAAVLATALAVGAAAVWVAGRGGETTNWPPLASARSAAAISQPRSDAETPVAARPNDGDRLAPLAVGASVMLAAQPALGRHATVDAAVGRQANDIIGRLESYRAAGALPSRVIVQIGENGPIFADDMRAMRSVLHGVRRVVLVNLRVPRRWNDDVNARLARAVENWPEARLADWYRASARPGVLWGDGTHPNPRGQRVYARVVARALR
jgi:peptidoglycan/LPS O-acetylase OafA/YrhL